MTTSPTCQSCGATTDAWLCARCADCRRPTGKRCGTCLADVLAELPARIADLRTVVTRQARVGNPAAPARPDEVAALADTEQRAVPAMLRGRDGRIALPANPTPVNLAAAALHGQAVTAVLTWARHIAETRGVALPESHVNRTALVIRCNRARVVLALGRAPVTIAQLCTWIVQHLDSIRLDEAAGEILTRLTDLAATIDATVDRRDPDIYAGRCDAPDVRVTTDCGTLTPTLSTCGADLYAHLGDATAECPTCGMIYDLADRKQWLLEQVPDVIATTAAIANALTSLREHVSPSMIRQMAYRGEIVQRGQDADRASLYRVGDVLAVLEARAERKRRKTA